MFKKTIGLLAAAALLVGCTSAPAATSAAPATSAASSAAAKPAIASFINGSLGDGAFFDDAESGIQKLKAEGYTTQSIQSTAGNQVQYKATMEQLSDGKYKYVVCGSADLKDILTDVAEKYPNQQYLIYDETVDAPNVASIMYRQNEGSFLAGVLAALVTTNKDKFPMATGKKIVGLVAGQDGPVIQDFIGGYKKGVESVDPSIQVKVSFVGAWDNPNKGYDQAKAMFDGGADVVYQVAGGSGMGVLKAAKDTKRYAIGVDSNQNAVQKGYVLASMLKRIGDSLVTAIHDADGGKLEFGKTTWYGLANEGVGLTFEDNGDIVPADIQAKIKDLGAKVASGEITVPSTIG